MQKNPFENLKKLLILKDKIDYYAIFKIGNLLYALKTNIIKEIMSSSEKKELPNTPEYIVGVINKDNQPITLIDLKRLVNDEFQEYNEKMYVINFIFDKKNYGFFTKEIVDIIPVDIGILKDVGEEMQEFYFVDKIFSFNGEIVLIINIEKILKNKTPV
ncbi:purine-binding chemotaxis protein CheW [Marinitoga hydrogenitolerans DSM 16785]|uniref:Purine-binding chemotaxis protein CheW n=1 Tax=Marinitoga hydrogenitolerans (strain DSM 16785 / JCM 12826 / AT1271) TaxID=1122195 RepID=A0A1M4WVT7_MARH1|nr:chemotaxis protein CheW [Marinitoga hydrogenitolerans]SHE85277.1 purine-binding chemotaxis protein CheW [Marinitoga hydrogenitolerans DSM 16785]